MSDATTMFDVVPDKSVVNGSSATIVLQSTRLPAEGSLAITELQSMTARNYALHLAASVFGLSTPGINGSLRVYPVDEQGEPLVDESGQMISKTPAAGWQVAIPVTARLV